MNESVCREFIQHLDQEESLESGRAPESVESWLKTLGLPRELFKMMLFDWPQSDGYFGHISIMSSSNIYACEWAAPLLKHNFLLAGNAPNGDFFVIDFSTEDCVPGFITHEEWSPAEKEQKDPRQFFQPIARSFGSFLYRVVEGRYLPTDYYAAKAFNAFVAEERKAGDAR